MSLMMHGGWKAALSGYVIDDAWRVKSQRCWLLAVHFELQ